MKTWRSVILALMLAAGTATAGPLLVTVDFSGVPTAQDITVPNSIHLNGVTFQYDPQGSGTTASADNVGIYGSTAGAMNLYFDFPAVGLEFDYFVSGGSGIPPSCSDGDCLDVIPGVGSPGTTANPQGTFSFGSFAGPPATPFNLVTMYFTLDVPTFDVRNVRYDSSVPEPGTFLMLGSCLLGLAGVKVFRRRS